MGSYPFPRNGILKLDYEFILVFKKPGQSEKIKKNVKELSKLSVDEWNTYFTGHWKLPGEKQSDHLAAFPIEIPNRLIKMFSFVGDTILDPFLGSGTTSVSAKNLERNSIGIEINGEFIPIIKQKFDQSIKEYFADHEMKYYQQKRIDTDYEQQINSLPYIFKDPHGLDKKNDAHKNNYGSKIKIEKP